MRHAFKVSTILVVFWALAIVGCGCPKGPPVPEGLRTPQGDEIPLRCPTPNSWETPVRPAPPAAEIGLCSLFPLDMEMMKFAPPCLSEPNDYVSSPGSNFFATENELEQLGRECGGNVDVYGVESWHMQVRLHLYLSTAGAKEAFARQTAYAKTVSANKSESPDLDLFTTLGEDRRLFHLRPQHTDRLNPDYDAYTLLVLRRNVVLDIWLLYDESANYKGPADPALEYAAAVDRNILAAAAGQLGTPTPEP